MLKQLETRMQNIMMIACFIYSGISFILFIIAILVLIKGGDVILLNSVVEEAYPDVTEIVGGIAVFFSTLIAIVSFFGCLIGLFAGLALQKVEKKEVVVHREEKEEDGVDGDLLTEDEKKIVENLEKNDRSMTQKDLVIESGFSKVKIHRVLKRLQAKKILSKYDYGMTNRIRLEKKIK